MSNDKKLSVEIRPDQLDDIQAAAPRANSESLAGAFRLAQALLDMEARKEPLTMILGRLEITNDLYREERRKAFVEEMAKINAANKDVSEELYDSIQLKPAFMGVGVDLKPLFKRLSKAMRSKK